MSATGGCTRRALRRREITHALLLLAGLLAGTAGPCAHAAQMVVATLDDASTTQCTLRDAIAAAAGNAATGACPAGDADSVADDEIVFDPALFPDGARGVISLASALPSLEGRTAISGPGARTLTIRRADDAPYFRILTIYGIHTRLSDFSLTHGVVVDDWGGGIYGFGEIELVRCAVADNQAIRSSRRFTSVYDHAPAGGGVYMSSGSLSLTDSRIANNRTVASRQYPADDGGGGGIYTSGALTLSRSIVHGNRSGAQGGGISGSGAMTIDDSEIAFNQGSSGGGIYASESPTIRSSAIHDNIAASEGGGLIVYGDDVHLERLTLYANHAGGDGGGILVRTFDENQFHLINSTLTGNSSDMGGGGIALVSQSRFDGLYLIHNSITHNSASQGGGVYLSGLDGLDRNGLALAANLIAANQAGTSPDVDAAINQSLATNLIGNSSGAVHAAVWPVQPITEADGYILNLDARLGPPLDEDLQRVQSVLSDSRAINAVDCYQVAVDQSGGPRPLDSRCEIGAHEFRGTLEQSLRFDAPRDRVFGDSPFQVSVAATRPLGTDVSSQVQVAALTPTVCDVSGRTVALHAAGLCTVEASLPAGSGGSGLPRIAVTRSFRIVESWPKTAQTIEFPALPDRVLSDPPLALEASASSGLAIAYDAQGPCTISAGMVSANATGVCTVSAAQDGDADYAAAEPVVRSFTIYPDGTTAPIVVTTLDDASTTRCTLRDAINAANDNATRGWCHAGDPNPLVTDTVQFDPRLFDGGAKRINLATPLPWLGGRVQLIGPGADLLDLHRSSEAAFRILGVSIGSEVLVRGLSLSGGAEGGVTQADNSSEAGFGGGVYNQGRLTLQRCVVRDNVARAGYLPFSQPYTGLIRPGAGGGIYNDLSGDLLLEDTTVSGNKAGVGSGGGIHNRRTLTLRNSLIASNEATGGVSRPPNAAALFGGEGGGIRSEGQGSLTLENTTVANNISHSHGGGISSSAGLRLRHASVTGNKAYWLDFGVPSSGGGVFGSLDLANSVIAGNWVETGTASDLSGGANQSGTNRIGGDPMLAALADNGGPTQTLLPLAGSPLLDTAPCLDDLAHDARGQPRPGANSTDMRCDIGAVELQQGGAVAQTIDFPPIGAHGFGAFVLEASASSGLAVVFSAEPASVCTVAGRMLTTIALGSCTVSASQPGNAEFAAAESVVQSFSVEFAAQTIAFDPLPERTFGDAPFALRASSSSGLPVSFTADGACSIDGDTVTLNAAGNCTITASQPGDEHTLPAEPVSRSFQILQLEQTITFDPLPDRTLGEAPFALGASASSGLPVSYAADGDCTVAQGTVTLTAVGTCTITASQPGDANVEPAEPVGHTFRIYTDTQAKPIVVTTLDDTSDTHCTLRDAILATNDNAAHGQCAAGNANPLAIDLIRFDPTLDDGMPKELRLDSVLPALTGRVEVAGPGADRLTIVRAADAPFRILDIEAGGGVQISDLGIQGGRDGGVTLPDGSSTAGVGGGVRNLGELTLRRCTIHDNSVSHGSVPGQTEGDAYRFATGGGLYNGAGAQLTIEDSTIRNNDAWYGDGGGVYNAGTLTVRASLIADNRSRGIAIRFLPLPPPPYPTGYLASGRGGGLFNSGVVQFENVSASGNRSDGDGGGLWTNDELALVHSTVASNHIESVLIPARAHVPIGGGIYARGRFALANSVIASNVARSDGNDLDGSVEQSGVNQIGGDPMLDAPADNGGPTHTLKPQLGSPLIDAAECLADVAVDPRGVARPSGARCDIGAFEYRQTRLSVEVGDGGLVSALPTPVPLQGGIASCAAATCSADYDGETDLTVTLSALPLAGYYLTAWGGDCSGAELAVDVVLDTDRHCTASFALITFAVGANAGPHGTVAPTTQSVPLNQIATVTVTPDTGYHVAQMTGCGGTLVGDLYTTAEITGDCTIDASFAIDTFTISAGAGPNGAIVPATQSVDYGAQATLNVAPDSGYRVDSVSGCGGTLSGDLYTTAPATADCAIEASFTLDVYAIGGTVEGLAGTGLVLQLNGGSDLPVAANGAFAFAQPLPNHDTYAVTVAQVPTSPAQICRVDNGNGTLDGADVTDIVVTCRVPQPSLSVSINDDRDYARYGMLLNYLVTITNSGDGDAADLHIGGDLPAQLDATYTRWICLGGGGGANCADSGSGPLDDAGVAIPAGRSLTWLVTAPVRVDAADSTIDYTIGVAEDAASATDSDALVLLRSGFDVPYGDGAEGRGSETAVSCLHPADWQTEISTELAATHVLVVPAPSPAMIDTPLRTDGNAPAGFRVERLNIGSAPRLRLVTTDAAGNERASDWGVGAVGAQLAIVTVFDAHDRGALLLEGSRPPLQMPLPNGFGGSVRPHRCN